MLTALGCQREDQNINKKLDDIAQRLTVIESKIGAAPGAGAARAQQPARAQPSPTAVYAVPVGESAVIGAKHAKVTIMEAFTFT
ncbi:MAG: hypothetical protein H0T42_17940 [Deltaproteobacteria bacterium]|nr:hypothetical protein [Deltaproteobacteria bacterium]